MVGVRREDEDGQMEAQKFVGVHLKVLAAGSAMWSREA
jgi:hypothetical protein